MNEITSERLQPAADALAELAGISIVEAMLRLRTTINVLGHTGYTVIPAPSLDVQADADAPGAYLRYTTAYEQDVFARALRRASRLIQDEKQRNSFVRSLVSTDSGPLSTPIADAISAAFRAGAEAMREAAAREVDCMCGHRNGKDYGGRDDVLAAAHKGDRWRACGRDPCGALAARDIRELPLPEMPE